MAGNPHKDYDSLRIEISTRHDTLSKRLRQIAAFALDHPTDMALETIAVIAKKADVPPSALIRFAKTFDYSGFSEMQKSFQSRVVERSANYKERVRALVPSESMEDLDEQDLTYSLLQQYCAADIASLEELVEGVIPEDLRAASSLLENADNVFIMAQRRSFSVATYLNYALNQVDCRTHLLDNFGGMLYENARVMRDKDVLVAISFPPYSTDTANVVSVASKKGIPVIVITDSTMSPISSAARVCLEVHDAEVHSFRSLTATMCIAHTLATSLAFRNKDKK